jgi:hypothetical protein
MVAVLGGPLLQQSRAARRSSVPFICATISLDVTLGYREIDAFRPGPMPIRL